MTQWRQAGCAVRWALGAGRFAAGQGYPCRGVRVHGPCFSYRALPAALAAVPGRWAVRFAPSHPGPVTRATRARAFVRTHTHTHTRGPLLRALRPSAPARDGAFAAGRGPPCLFYSNAPLSTAHPPHTHTPPPHRAIAAKRHTHTSPIQNTHTSPLYTLSLFFPVCFCRSASPTAEHSANRRYTQYSTAQHSTAQQ